MRRTGSAAVARPSTHVAAAAAAAPWAVPLARRAAAGRAPSVLTRLCAQTYQGFTMDSMKNLGSMRFKTAARDDSHRCLICSTWKELKFPNFCPVVCISLS